MRIKEGTIIFNISVDKLQMFRNGIWESVTTNISTATSWVIFISFFHSIRLRVAVDVAANQVNGFIYNDTTNNQVRGYINSQWMTHFRLLRLLPASVLLTEYLCLSIWAKRNVEVAANKSMGSLILMLPTQFLEPIKMPGRQLPQLKKLKSC